MLEKNKLKIIISSATILIPMLIGCILWPKLPDTIATHFGTDNAANDWSSKGFTVFAMPLILLALHLVCLIATNADPKNKNIGKKPLSMVFWIVPAISLVIFPMIYANALGSEVNVGFIMSLLIGIMLIVLGNVMPKAKQNYTFGLKLPWTLKDSENWNKTHRLSGWCYVIAGVIILATSFLNNVWIFLPTLILAVGIPIVYSYVYYRKHKTES
ncbi:MAG: SdpI family protein [Faecalibacterium sp.]|nr:SdpI family protein [Ruminococcus sp.]MCM1392354.1 SdpI family protein [Ruminococcus sp.]MCM1486009.1 SdpI family protein [Faecalibacterium sp.]